MQSDDLMEILKVINFRLLSAIKTRGAVRDTVIIVHNTPEILTAIGGEVECLILLFNRIKYADKALGNDWNLLINADKTRRILRENEEVPLFFETCLEIFQGGKKGNINLLRAEIVKFGFFDKIENPFQLLYVFQIAIYRTWILIKNERLKKHGAQIASTIEEMAAILTLEGMETNIFYAVRHWIFDCEKEGFSKGLSERLEEKLKNKKNTYRRICACLCHK
jgi:hypothetical protein